MKIVSVRKALVLSALVTIFATSVHANEQTLSAQLGNRDLDINSVDSIDGDALDREMLKLMDRVPEESATENAVADQTATQTDSPATDAREKALSAPSTSTRAAFCSESRQPGNAQRRGQVEDNLMAFENDGGLLNGGVCWWHSRMQRSSLYLAVFRPELPRPSHDEANALLKKLERNEGVVEIGGYRNWHEFSNDQEALIQHRLNLWQLSDGFLRQAWIRGLANPAVAKPSRAAEQLKKLMQAISYEVESLKRVTYVKVQLPGITSHAWLILAAHPTATGINLTILDSNYLTVTWYTYKYGDHAINVYDTRGFLPYVEQRGDFAKLDAAIANYCR